MTKKVIAINASPRAKWNTAQLVQEAAGGAEDVGAEIEVINLYQLEPFMGCRSCFACMTKEHYDRCAIKDGLTEVLDKIAEADGLILGSPIYFARPTAGFRALLERLCFQHLTYDVDHINSNERSIPVLLILTSNLPASRYDSAGYSVMIREHEKELGQFIGPTTSFICGDTLHTKHYEKYNWPMIDPEAKQQRHDEEFPQELARVRELASKLFA